MDHTLPHPDVQKWRDLEAVRERGGAGMLCATVVRVRGMHMRALSPHCCIAGGHGWQGADSTGTRHGKAPSDGFILVLAILLTEEDWKI